MKKLFLLSLFAVPFITVHAEESMLDSRALLEDVYEALPHDIDPQMNQEIIDISRKTNILHDAIAQTIKKLNNVISQINTHDGLIRSILTSMAKK